MKKIIYLFGIFTTFIFTATNSYSADKVLKMGVDVSSLPFVYIDGDGEITGFEVELIKEVGKLKGFDVIVVPQIYPGIFNHLAEKKIDFIGHVYYSKERAEKYLLSDPYYVDKVQLAALKDNPANDLLNDQITISTLSHSPLAGILHTLSEDHSNITPNMEFSAFTAFKALFMKKADVLLATETGIYLYTNNYDQYQYKTFPMPADYTQELPISFLALKEDAEFIEQLNDGIKQIKASPLYQQLKEKYKVL